MLTPQIRSEKVSFTKLTVLSAPAEVSVGGAVNKVSISDGSASVCAVSDEATRQGLNYIRQLQILFDGSVPVCEFEYFAPRFEYRGFLIDTFTPSHGVPPASSPLELTFCTKGRFHFLPTLPSSTPNAGAM